MDKRDLQVTSPLMVGPDVLAVQRRLLALGFDPGPLDGQYGPATARTVRAFQAAAAIEVDGIVGPETRKALKTAALPPPRPPDDGGGEIGRRALAEARTFLGTTEDPPGSNRTQFGTWFGVDGVPWCNIFVSYCFAVGGGHPLAAGFAGAGCTRKGCSYVPTTEAWLRATGQWLGRITPRPGDIAIYNWDGGVPDHIGIVEAAKGNAFTAIEGNTAIGNDSNGGAVMRRHRTLAQVDGFGRIHDRQ